MTCEFSIAGWSGCAPGLHSQADWAQWAERPQLPGGEIVAPLSAMPPLIRRRLSGVGRLVAEAAYNCSANVDAAEVPVVLASRYGDAGRSLELITGFSHDGAVSPTDFALSVHNAIGAVYSIARRDRSNYISVAGGAASATAAIWEAVALLGSGASEVLIVCYDAELPTPYQVFQDEPAASYAWVWRVAKPNPAYPSFQLRSSPCESFPQEPLPVLPFGLDVMRFVLSSDVEWRRQCDGIAWTLTRHG